MKRILFSLFCLLCCAAMQAQLSFGQARLINDDWRFFRADTAWNAFERPEMKAADYDDASWRRVSLPHDWGIELPMSPDKGSCQGYLAGGIGWYRKRLGPELAGKGVTYLYFEGVYNHAEVYLNGQLLGCRPSGFASFYYDITPYLRPNGENVVAVRADHSAEADSRWYTGSGIYRNVWLVTAPQLHLSPWGTAYRLKHIDRKKAVVDVDIETTDQRQAPSSTPLRAVVELTDADGTVVATTQTSLKGGEKKTVTLSVPAPKRWTLSLPYLYTLTTRLIDNGSETDRSTVKAGLRTLEFSPDKGFALNGEWMKAKGVCLHDDAGALGTAVPKSVWRRRLSELKAIGVNAIRMSHNPHAPMLYDLCDELGLLVMDEASDEWELPKRKWMKGWNQGRPAFEGTYTYFNEWIERDVADMVRRDRCHPSVFLWSIGNEVDYPNDPYSHPVLDGSAITQPMYGGYKPDQPDARRIGEIAQRLVRVVRQIDTSRPTTGALAGVVMSNETVYPEAIDVVGYNYTESRYDEDHKKYPRRVIYGSENRHDLQAWQAVTGHDHIFGQFLWTGIDYLGESGVWPARGSSAGLLDMAGWRKPIGWYRAALWSDSPVCYAGTMALPPAGRRGNRRPRVSPYASDLWNYQEGQQVRVVCYTNAPTASLLLNGQPVGAEPQRDEASGILFWDVDYAPGTLVCQASNGASYTLSTTGRPAALRITVDQTAAATADDVLNVVIELLDDNGRRARMADNEVQLQVVGGRLLGMENGSIDNCQPPRRSPEFRPQNRLRALDGRLVAYVQPLPAAPDGKIILRASSPLLGVQTLEVTP